MKSISPAAAAIGFLAGAVLAAAFMGQANAKPAIKTFRDCSDCPEMVVVPSGSFDMGSPSTEEGRRGNEGAVHRVTIGASFAVGKYEVTQQEFESLMGYNPSLKKNAPRDPVGNLTMHEAHAFLKKLSGKTGKNYRLLSEAEWEYSARAGTRTPWYCGKNYKCVHDIAVWYYSPNRSTAPVGSKKPNAFGLYDMSGNVAEMVADPTRYRPSGEEAYDGAPTDGSVWPCRPARGHESFRGSCQYDRHVIRGGSWHDDVWVQRSADRSSQAASDKSAVIGFRVARDLP